ncbi:MAG: aldo/keto reductase [Rhodococcus fascians]
MKYYEMFAGGPRASSIVLGLMRIEALDNASIAKLVGTARDAGVSVFDHADIYGTSRHGCERRFGDAVTFLPSEREQVVIQSKVGIRDGFYDFSKAHILDTVEKSLSALRMDHLDVLLLHRPDSLVEPSEVAAAFDALHSAGKVRSFGVSNHTPGQIQLLATEVTQPLIIDQVQLSLTHAPLIAAGLASNIGGLDQSIDLSNGLLDYARINDIALQAWSPFQSGYTGKVFIGDRDNYPELNDALDDLARDHGVTPTSIATAWLTRHPAKMQVVLGTTTPSRVAEAVAGSDISLSREEWYRLFRAAGYRLP